ncbi:MAG: PaaI family thioesterase [Syntrophaceae bacterium]|nr:PaaI family thioesterase [Syntrophaceae bacterium]
MTEELASPYSTDQIRARVLRAIVANRRPGLHFLGHFLNFEWRKADADGVCTALPFGDHCRAANGEVDLMALGAFIDLSMTAAVRTATKVPSHGRLGTIYLQAQFLGIPAVGDLVADTHFLGQNHGTALRQNTAAGTIHAQGQPFCHISGAFVLLEMPESVAIGPMPWEQTETPPVVPVSENKLEPQERAILKSCAAALRTASEASFIDRFWGPQPRRTAYGASSRIPISPQIMNRVGHVQGGALFGLAAANANAAAPQAMRLSNHSAFFISFGRGSALTIRSRLLHVGRATAVVRTEIRNAGGERILEATSNYLARKNN